MNKRKPVVKLIVAAILLILLLIGYYTADVSFRRNVLYAGEPIAKRIAINVMDQSINQALLDTGGTAGLLQVEKDTEGKVTMLSANSDIMNRIARRVSVLSQQALDNMAKKPIDVPLGNMIGSYLFSGRGPNVTVYAIPQGAVITSFHADFESAGINQTRYKVYITVNAEVNLIVGNEVEPIAVATEVLIADTVVVGDVPQTFANLPSTGDLLNLVPT